MTTQAGLRTKPINYAIFNMLIPQSCLLKALQFTFFGHTIPKTTSGSHLVEPPCPFVAYDTLTAYKMAVSQLYPSRKEGSSLNYATLIDEQDGVELMSEK